MWITFIHTTENWGKSAPIFSGCHPTQTRYIEVIHNNPLIIHNGIHLKFTPTLRRPKPLNRRIRNRRIGLPADKMADMTDEQENDRHYVVDRPDESPLNSVTRAFVQAHRDENVRDLALKTKRAEQLDLPTALDQIAGWQIACKKLPRWAQSPEIVYPPHISMEQCSSQFTAQYKSEIARRLCAIPKDGAQFVTRSMVDLTGGFGVDFSYLAREFDQATYVERQPLLCELAAHNMAALEIRQARIVCGDGVGYLHSMEPVNLIYVDPARRDEHGSRTYAIEDCSPNVLDLRDSLLGKSEFTMIKLSPMLDWRKAVADFKGAVAEVHIVSTGNECKELLLVLSRSHSDGAVRAPHVYCVNDGQRIDYDSAAYTQGLRVGSSPLPEMTYLYEPNASIMKAGCFDLVEERYGVRQIGPSSHLFIADKPVEDFPGRGFMIEGVSGMGKKDVKRLLAGTRQANIAVRNFPLTATQLRKKLNMADGGSVYLFGTTMQGDAHMLLRTSKIGQ